MAEYRGMEYTENSTLPSAGLCALMSYEYLKTGGLGEAALAWATLGNLILNLPDRTPANEAKLAIEVAKAAHAVAVENTDQNRLSLQNALQAWIDVA